ncbi:hypothetical protein ACEPAI_1865 [Sanghuangporus weigelae]
MVATRQMTKARAAKQGGSGAAARALTQTGAPKAIVAPTNTVTRRGARRGAANNCTSAQREGSSAATLYDVKEAEESASTSLSNSKGKKGSTRSSGPVQTTTTTTTTTTQTCGLYLEVKIEHISASISGHSGKVSSTNISFISLSETCLTDTSSPPPPPPKKVRQPRKAPAEGGKPKANTKRGKAAEKTAAVPDNETVVTGSKRRRDDADDDDEGQPETSRQGARRTRRRVEPPADQESEPLVKRTRSRKAPAAAIPTPEPPKPRASRRKAQASRPEPAPSKSRVTRKEVAASHDATAEAEGKVRKNKGKGKAVDLPSSEVATVGSKRRRDEEDVDVEDVTQSPVDPGPSRRTTRRTRQKVEGPVKSESSTEIARPRRRTTRTKAANKGKGKAKDESLDPVEPKRESLEPEGQDRQSSPGATNSVLIKQESQYSSPVPITEESTSGSNAKASSSAVCKKEEPSSSPLRLLLTAMDYSEWEAAAIAPLDTHAPSQAEPAPTLPIDGPSSTVSRLDPSVPALTLKPEESMLILAPRRVLPESALRGTYFGDEEEEEEEEEEEARSSRSSEADDDDGRDDSRGAVIQAWSAFTSLCLEACANMGSFAASSLAQQDSGCPARTSPASINAVPKSGTRGGAANCVSSVTPGARSEEDERSPTSSSEVSEMLGDGVRSDSEDDETSPCRTSGALTVVSHKSLTRLSPPSRRSLTILPASFEQRDAGSSSMALVLYDRGSSKTENGKAGPSRLPERTPPSPAPSDVSFPSDSFGLHSDDEIEIEWTGGPEPAPEPPTPPPIRAARTARPPVAPHSTPSPTKSPAGPSQTEGREEDHDRVFHTEDEVPPELRKAYRFARSTAFSYLRGGVREKSLLGMQKWVFGLDPRFSTMR